MGTKLKTLYDFVIQNGGMQERMRVAMKSGISSSKAPDLPDTPENISKLKAAIKEVMGKNPPNV
ncbi:MAG: hypothetical protein JXR95_03390 [Deltaproteobacteria bacterium]|nr:hypothetical protein [Deltaproteobacteria bacterium]